MSESATSYDKLAAIANRVTLWVLFKQYKIIYMYMYFHKTLDGPIRISGSGLINSSYIYYWHSSVL